MRGLTAREWRQIDKFIAEVRAQADADLRALRSLAKGAATGGKGERRMTRNTTRGKERQEEQVEALLREADEGFRRKRAETKGENIAVRGEPGPARTGMGKPAKPSFGEPEGGKPGRRPTVAEPDVPESPRGFAQAEPLEDLPGHASTGSARSVPGDVDDPLWQSTLQAAALNLARLVPRPVSDLRGMLEREVEDIRSRRSVDRAGALMEAQETIFRRIRGGFA